MPGPEEDGLREEGAESGSERVEFVVGPDVPQVQSPEHRMGLAERARAGREALLGDARARLAAIRTAKHDTGGGDGSDVLSARETAAEAQIDHLEDGKAEFAAMQQSVELARSLIADDELLARTREELDRGAADNELVTAMAVAMAGPMGEAKKFADKDLPGKAEELRRQAIARGREVWQLWHSKDRFSDFDTPKEKALDYAGRGGVGRLVREGIPAAFRAGLENGAKWSTYGRASEAILKWANEPELGDSSHPIEAVIASANPRLVSKHAPESGASAETADRIRVQYREQRSRAMQVAIERAKAMLADEDLLRKTRKEFRPDDTSDNALVTGMALSMIGPLEQAQNALARHDQETAGELYQYAGARARTTWDLAFNGQENTDQDSAAGRVRAMKFAMRNRATRYVAEPAHQIHERDPSFEIHWKPQ